MAFGWFSKLMLGKVRSEDELDASTDTITSLIMMRDVLGTLKLDGAAREMTTRMLVPMVLKRLADEDTSGT